MRAKDNMRTAAEVLVDQLQIHGVQHVFCAPADASTPTLRCSVRPAGLRT